MDEISQIIANDPENFDALYRMTRRYYDERNYAVCFIMSERAISSFEKQPREDSHAQYFELKQMHYKMLHENLQDIIGPAYHLLNPRWTPTFHLGKIREMAWWVNRSNVLNIRQALNAVQLKRLRFLNITIEEVSENALFQLMYSPLSSLRALTMQFVETPSMDVLCEFFETVAPIIQDVDTFGLRMERIDDELASLIWHSLGNLDAFSLTSMDRSGITSKFCEEIADDPKARSLTRLCLVGTSIGNEGLFSLMSSENLPSLQALDLHDGILTNAAAKVVTASAQSLPALHSIDLRYNMIDPAGVDALNNCSMTCYCDNQHTRPEGR